MDRGTYREEGRKEVQQAEEGMAKMKGRVWQRWTILQRLVVTHKGLMRMEDEE